MTTRMLFLVGIIGWVLPMVAARADAPRVVKLVPRNGATKVNPATTELCITFDTDMDTSGFSLCGGGPSFPKFDGRPEWTDERTLVAKVVLEPDHDYELSINCPAAQNFSSLDGTPAESLRWTFSTAGGSGLSAGEQKQLNEKSLKQLMTILRERYSYYELQGIDWKALEKKHRRKIEDADDTRAWVAASAKMLAAAKDLHLWLVYRDRTTPTFQHKIEPNFGLAGLKKALPKLRQRNACVHTAVTKDRIGYLLIGTLSAARRQELEEVPDILREMQDCRALVVDLRANGGGDELLAQPIAAWFVSGERTYSKSLLRDPKAPDGFAGPFERKIRGNDAADRFDGPVAVLIGPGVMSSAESFALMMKQGEQVVLVGAATRGSSGNPKPHKLANGVQVFVPSWKDLLPTGDLLEGKGVKPDVEVSAKARQFEAGDPVLERALALLREKLKSGKP